MSGTVVFAVRHQNGVRGHYGLQEALEHPSVRMLLLMFLLVLLGMLFFFLFCHFKIILSKLDGFLLFRIGFADLQKV